MDLSGLDPFANRYLSGISITLQLVVFSVAIGAVLSGLLTAARLSPSRLLSWPALAFSTFFRGTPLLAQTFLIYYGAGQFRPELQSLGLWNLFREAYFCVLLTFALNTAAYQSEIWRGALRSVAKGQWEASAALGVSRPVTLFKVVVPQAFVIALRPLGNEVILMVKASAIASVVTVYDIMGVTRLAFARTFDFTYYLWAAVLYLVIVEVLRRVLEAVERRITRYQRRDPDKTSAAARPATA